MNADLLQAVTPLTDACKVCAAQSRLFDVVDFHGNMDLDPQRPERAKVFPLTGIPIYYYQCGRCGLVYTRALDHFSDTDFKQRIYDALWMQHFLGDPDERARQVASVCSLLFKGQAQVRGLDYGGGGGHLCAALKKAGYDFDSFDPHYGRTSKPDKKYNLITCIEVFEHITDIPALMDDLDQLCAPNGGVFFSTALVEATRKLQGWAYCIPRCGHITFFSRQSLKTLFANHNFEYQYLGMVHGMASHFAGRGHIPYLAQNQTP